VFPTHTLRLLAYVGTQPVVPKPLPKFAPAALVTAQAKQSRITRKHSRVRSDKTTSFAVCSVCLWLAIAANGESSRADSRHTLFENSSYSLHSQNILQSKECVVTISHPCLIIHIEECWTALSARLSCGHVAELPALSVTPSQAEPARRSQRPDKLHPPWGPLHIQQLLDFQLNSIEWLS
jgi:hypothetical protein